MSDELDATTHNIYTERRRRRKYWFKKIVKRRKVTYTSLKLIPYALQIYDWKMLLGQAEINLDIMAQVRRRMYFRTGSPRKYSKKIDSKSDITCTPDRASNKLLSLLISYTPTYLQIKLYLKWIKMWFRKKVREISHIIRKWLNIRILIPEIRI